MTAGESRDVPASSGALDVAAIQARAKQARRREGLRCRCTAQGTQDGAK